MAHVTRLAPPPEDISLAARALITELGARGAARRLRVTRQLLVSAAASCPMQEGSVLLLLSRFSELKEAA